MLLLNRRVGEKIIIDTHPNRIVITVTAATSRSVKIGVEAPPEITVMRNELLDEPKGESRPKSA